VIGTSLGEFAAVIFAGIMDACEVGSEPHAITRLKSVFPG
jgi:hypothetical protein